MGCRQRLLIVWVLMGGQQTDPFLCRGATLFDLEPCYSHRCWAPLLSFRKQCFFTVGLFPPLSCNPRFLSLKELHTKLQPTPALLIRDQGACISLYLFSSPNACALWALWLLGCALPSLHHRASIFTLFFQPIAFGCPISLCFSNVKASKQLAGFLRFLRLSVLETFTMLLANWVLRGNTAF